MKNWFSCQKIVSSGVTRVSLISQASQYADVSSVLLLQHNILHNVTCSLQVEESWFTTRVLCCSTVGLQRSYKTTTDHFQTQHQLSQQLKCNNLTPLASEKNAQQGEIHPAAEDFIEMQDDAFGAVPC